MKTKPCKHCGHTVATGAIVCMNCGGKLRRTSVDSIKWLMVIGLILWIIAIIASSGAK